MSTLIDRQVAAFGDAVVEAHKEAMAFWTVQDVASAGPGVARAVLQIITQHRSESPLSDESVQAFCLACRKLLRVMTQGRKMIREMKARGFDVKGEPEFADAMLEVREALVLLEESSEHPFEAPPNAAVPADEPVEPELPPQKWFEEDVRGLRGLG
jgi:hypothetical protein